MWKVFLPNGGGIICEHIVCFECIKNSIAEQKENPWLDFYVEIVLNLNEKRTHEPNFK